MGRIIFRLRPGKDDDLEEKLEAEKDNKSAAIREALRAYYFGTPQQARPERKLEADVSEIQLEQKEKTSDEVEAGLDDLLNF